MIRSTQLTSALAQRFSQVSLNPQPLPPRESSILPDSVSLNPQPLPPRDKSSVMGDSVSLNPQPLPPKAHSSVADRVALNPQPLPPRSLLTAFARAFSEASRVLDSPAADRGIIVVGGRSVLPSALNQRGIIVVGG